MERKDKIILISIIMVIVALIVLLFIPLKSSKKTKKIKEKGGMEEVLSILVLKNSNYIMMNEISILKNNVLFLQANLGADEYLWDFGDGLASRNESPNHRYRRPGRYRLKLHTKKDGVVSSVSLRVLVINTKTKTKKWGKVGNLSEEDLNLLITAMVKREGDGSSSTRPTRNNNPLNIKIPSGGLKEAQNRYNDLKAEKDPKPATDGGYFIKFSSREKGFEAAKILLTGDYGYRDLDVESALRRWSNNAYGAEIM